MTNQEEEIERNNAATDSKIVGIRGWLFLPAIGFFLGPIISVVSIIAAFGLFSRVQSAGYGGVYALELVVEVGMFAFLIYCAIRFFGKKSNAPSAIIALFIASIGASVLLIIIELAAGAEIFATATGKQLIREVIGAAIWIPYFRNSRRVKATFVN